MNTRSLLARPVFSRSCLPPVDVSSCINSHVIHSPLQPWHDSSHPGRTALGQASPCTFMALSSSSTFGGGAAPAAYYFRPPHSDHARVPRIHRLVASPHSMTRTPVSTTQPHPVLSALVVLLAAASASDIRSGLLLLQLPKSHPSPLWATAEAQVSIDTHPAARGRQRGRESLALQHGPSNRSANSNRCNQYRYVLPPRILRRIC